MGASTSLSGVFGIYIYYLIFGLKKRNNLARLSSSFLFICLALVGMFIGFFFDIGVDSFGHLGGFITGLLLGAGFIPHKKKPHKNTCLIVIKSLFVLLTVLYLLVTTAVLFYHPLGRCNRG